MCLCRNEEILKRSASIEKRIGTLRRRVQRCNVVHWIHRAALHPNGRFWLRQQGIAVLVPAVPRPLPNRHAGMWCGVAMCTDTIVPPQGFGDSHQGVADCVA
eukprot:EG_transcript_19877